MREICMSGSTREREAAVIGLGTSHSVAFLSTLLVFFCMALSQNANWMRVNSTFSGFRVTIAGADVPAPPPPVKLVWEKLVFTITFRFKYQLRPSDQAAAERAEVAGSANSGNAA